MKKMALFVAVGFFSLLFISRFYFFATTQNAGIEHDSGWYLGVARNVAERGIYASFVNTIAGSSARGSFPSIHGRFSVQDDKGYSYFPAGVTVGPGFILPEALILKIFGVGWLQYRAFPFVCFCVLVFLMLFVVYRYGGIIALAFFAAWLWFYPQVWLSMSFEAFSEHIALLYFLAGLLIVSRKKSSTPVFVLGGLLVGLSVQTKTLFMLGVPVLLLVHFLWTRSLKKTMFLGLIVAVPTLVFETYRFLYLFSHFGMKGYEAINKDNYLTMKTSGSGMNILKYGIPQWFLLAKLNTWKHVGITPVLVAFPLIPAVFFRKTIPRFAWLLTLSAVAFYVWYLVLSTTGWFRHAFPAITIGMIALSILYSRIIIALYSKKQFVIFVLVVAGCFVSVFQMAYSPLAIPSYVLTKPELNKTTQYIVNGLQGPLFSPVFPRNDQETVTKYIRSSLPLFSKLCYRGGFLVAELPALVDRVIYPMPRCGKGDTLVVGPYQRGEYSFIHDKSEMTLYVQETCEKTLYENPSYFLCSLK